MYQVSTLYALHLHSVYHCVYYVAGTVLWISGIDKKCCEKLCRAMAKGVVLRIKLFRFNAMLNHELYDIGQSFLASLCFCKTSIVFNSLPY